MKNLLTVSILLFALPVAAVARIPALRGNYCRACALCAVKLEFVWLESADRDNDTCENETHHCHQFNQDVQRGACGILERVVQSYYFFLIYANFRTFFCVFSAFRHPLEKQHSVS